MDLRIAAGLSYRQKRKEECPSGRTAPEREGAAGGALVSALSVQTFAAPPDLTTAVLPSAVLESRESSF